MIYLSRNIISLSYIAKHYFGKDKSWIYRNNVLQYTIKK
ncbi:DUF5053 domain-containing protein [Bacteroides acidifaciens]